VLFSLHLSLTNLESHFYLIVSISSLMNPTFHLHIFAYKLYISSSKCHSPQSLLIEIGSLPPTRCPCEVIFSHWRWNLVVTIGCCKLVISRPQHGSSIGVIEGWLTSECEKFMVFVRTHGSFI